MAIYKRDTSNRAKNLCTVYTVFELDDELKIFKIKIFHSNIA